MPGIIGNLAEAVRPIVAPPGKNFNGLVNDVDLNAVAIELDLVQPAVAAGHLLDRRCQCRLDKARVEGLGADHRRLFALGRAQLTPASG